MRTKMPVPDYQSFMRPLLAFAADGGEKNITDAIEALATEFNLSPQDREELNRHSLLIGFTGPERI
jgi:restriction system protein